MHNVLIYIIDALRADHLGCFGYGRSTSPAIDAFAAEPGVVRFRHAYSPSTWTKPVAASILSGCYPPAHGARTRSDLFMRAVPRLPEILQSAGYRTAAVSAIGNVSSALGFGAGFDHFVDLYKDSALASRRRVSNTGAWKLYHEQETAVVLPLAEDVNQRAMPWLAGGAQFETSATAQPWFLLLWSLDPHDPYLPPPGFDRWRDPGYTGRVDGSSESVRQARTPADVQRLVDLYDGEIAYADEQFGRLIGALRDAGQYDDMLIVLAGDHGEAFGEHGDFVHGHLAYEEVMHVPLLVKFPPGTAVQSGVVDTLAQLTDVAPTVLDALGLSHLAVDMQGISLLPMLRGGDASSSLAYSETQASAANNRLLAVRSARWKYLRIDPPGDYGGSHAEARPASARQRLAGYVRQLANPEMVKRLLRNPTFYLRRQMAARRMLFDLDADPAERVNVIDRSPAVVAELDAALEAWLADCQSYVQLNDAHTAPGLDEATRAQLRGLGYL